jgi:type 1 glutamine amidotransferase
MSPATAFLGPIALCLLTAQGAPATAPAPATPPAGAAAPSPAPAPPPAPPGPPPELAAMYDQSGVALEIDAPRGKGNLAKIVLVAGKASHAPGHHEYFAGLALLADMLRQHKGVWPVMVRDGWPRDPRILEGARSIVFYADGGKGHPILTGDHMDVLQKYIDRGAGFACIHYGVNFPKEVSDRIVTWLGGHYHPEISSSPATTWVADYKSLPRHPVTRGLKPFVLKDEWYFNMRFVDGMKGVTPLLKAVPPEEARTSEDAKKHPGREEITAWAYERPNKGRSFGTTAGHYHDNWGDESLRRLVTNGILWTAKIDPPRAGAAVKLDPADLKKNLDWKPPKPKR